MDNRYTEMEQAFARNFGHPAAVCKGPIHVAHTESRPATSNVNMLRIFMNYYDRRLMLCSTESLIFSVRLTVYAAQ